MLPPPIPAPAQVFPGKTAKLRHALSRQNQQCRPKLTTANSESLGMLKSTNLREKREKMCLHVRTPTSAKAAPKWAPQLASGMRRPTRPSSNVYLRCCSYRERGIVSHAFVFLWNIRLKVGIEPGGTTTRYSLGSNNASLIKVSRL